MQIIGRGSESNGKKFCCVCVCVKKKKKKGIKINAEKSKVVVLDWEEGSIWRSLYLVRDRKMYRSIVLYEYVLGSMLDE